MPASLNYDLRSEAKDYRRVKEHNAKWSRGAKPLPGTRCAHSFAWDASCNECDKRPVRGQTQNRSSIREYRRNVAHNDHAAKKALRSDFVEASDTNLDNFSDSSTDVDVEDASAAPELKDVMYSYDAPTGPGHGSQILSYAINQAVQRYENNETDKIVKNEYDLVTDGKDEPESFVADTDDDFELIDGSHLK